jgi:hypothetical protein
MYIAIEFNPSGPGAYWQDLGSWIGGPWGRAGIPQTAAEN